MFGLGLGGGGGGGVGEWFLGFVLFSCLFVCLGGGFLKI